MNLNVVSLHQSHSRASVLKSAQDRSSSFSSEFHTNTDSRIRTGHKHAVWCKHGYVLRENKQANHKQGENTLAHTPRQYFNPRFTCPSITNTQVNGLANNVNTLNQLREKKRWIKNTDLPAVWIQQKTRMRKSSCTEHVFPFKLN